MSPKPRRARSSGVARAAPLFAALGNAMRLDLVQRLCANGRASIVELTEGTRVTRQAVTKHLHVLQDAGLVRETGKGRASAWEVDLARLAEAHRCLDHIESQWDEALHRLKASLESETK